MVKIQGSNVVVATTESPSVSDDSSSGFAVGDRWINKTAGSHFVCTSDAAGAAVWVDASVQAGSIEYDKLQIKHVAVFVGDVNQVMTADRMLGGIFTLADSIISAGRTVTTATAAALDVGLPGAITGTSFPFVIVNNDAASTLTLVADVGVTLNPAVPTIPALQQRGFTAVKTGAGAWTIFGG